MLNQEILQQREEVTAQRDAMTEKNKLIEKLNIELSSMNYNLEKLVEKRTNVLESQNKALMEYAFINAHKLRSPVSIGSALDIGLNSSDQKGKNNLNN